MRAIWIGYLCLAVMSPAIAEDDYNLTGLMRPGLWETETQEVSSDGELGPAETDRECITPEEIEDFSSFTRDQQSANMKVAEFERGDDSVRYRITFGSDPGTADPAVGEMLAEMEFDGPERYQGEMKFEMKYQGQSMEHRSRISGRRIGECSAEDAED